MTDRLAQLMHDEADRLPVPPPPVELIAARGRRDRRRRTATTALAGIAAALVIGGATWGATQLFEDEEVQPISPNGMGPVFSIFDTAYVDGSPVQLRNGVEEFHYTADGVLLRVLGQGTGTAPLTFVSPDGEATSVGSVPTLARIATDPRSEEVAIALINDGRVTVELREAATGDLVKRLPLTGVEAGPEDGATVSLTPDAVFVNVYGERPRMIDIESGEVSTVPEMSGAAGRTVTAGPDFDLFRVVDARTGAELLEIDPRGLAIVTLSPDGRYARVEPTDSRRDDPGVTTDFYDVATGDKVALPGWNGDFGWTARGEPFIVDPLEDSLTTCDVASGECTTREVVLPDSAARGKCQGGICDVSRRITWAGQGISR